MTARPPGLYLHQRARPVRSATLKVKDAMLGLLQELDLTYIEMLRALQETQDDILRWMLREERHPGEPDHKADEE